MSENQSNDDAYANGAYIDGAADYPARWEGQAQDWRMHENTAGRARLNLVYGDALRQKFDLFLPESKPLGTLIFVHGGYWKAFDNKSWSHLAKGAQARGWAVAMPSYTLCPEVKIADITEEIRQALHHIASITQGPIALAGHSAGGHLVARMLCQDVPLAPEVADRIVKVTPISPLSDLRPLVDTEMNIDFAMNAETAWAESPLREVTPRTVPVACWVGGGERPAFIDQATWLAKAWGGDLNIDADLHHFNVIDGLADEHSALLMACLGL
ncbi:alpha/beta hydrolase [Halocynthiibacter namhaensis]|uniref:alpha/beta hydrolase n=1 Tax=Halocynthiibacter namhaensis TaxID=1290553 RepID=UPI000578F23F|nr:alpha/beta hydrolase [Halocynthiibacter namhaensis]